MEGERIGMNNYYPLRDTSDHAAEIFELLDKHITAELNRSMLWDQAAEILERIDKHITTELNRGMVWQIVVDERTADMEHSMRRLAAATVTNHSGGCDHISPSTREGFRSTLISGVGFRCLGFNRWNLESVWDSVEIHDIRVSEDFEWRPIMSYNAERDVTMSKEESITVWWRGIKDWNRPEGNILSLQILWSGSFSYRERVLQLLDDVYSSNALHIISEQFTLHPQLRAQYIARYETNPVAAAYAAIDSSISITVSHELIATKGGDGDGLLCAICHEIISTGEHARQLPCDHLFHDLCIFKWFEQQLSCPLCRYEFQ